MNGENRKDTSSGTVHIDDDKIFWDYKGQNIVRVDVKDVVVIGEYTNSDGPYFDDWFLTFVTRDGQWQSIPWYAENRGELQKYLTQRFQCNFNVSLLTGSFEWNSLVRFPAHLEGKTLFVLFPTEKYKAPKNLFEKILSSMGFGGFDTTKYVLLTDDVKNEVNNACR